MKSKRRASRASRASHWVGILALAGLCACATPEGPQGDAADPGGAAPQLRPNPDPWEPMNRGIFVFNDYLDRWVVGPVARGWKFISPASVRQGLSNLYDTVNMPIVLANDLMMLRPERVGQDVGRLAVNLVFGLGGIFDAASEWGIPQNDSDFGLTLGYWGLPQGPYLYLPVLGPSTVRDTVGIAGDGALQPYTYFFTLWGNILVRVPYYINLRAQFDEELTQSRRDAFDYYVFVRNAYLQNRRFRVDALRGVPGAQAEEEDDLYYFDEDDPDAEIQEP